MCCLSVYFNLFCGEFSVFHLQSICFQKGLQYAYIMLPSHFNFPCDMLVSPCFICKSICIKKVHQFVLVKFCIWFNILYGQCSFMVSSVSVLCSLLLAQSVSDCVYSVLKLQQCVLTSLNVFANLLSHVTFYTLDYLFLFNLLCDL